MPEEPNISDEWTDAEQWAWKTDARTAQPGSIIR